MLTIYIPTFNRVENLKHVISNLIAEVDSNPVLSKLVKIKVFNNCSTDDTSMFIDSICRPYFSAYHREKNVGARVNVYDGIHHCDTEFLWILGDDDLPMPGVLTLVVKFVKDRKPNLLYLPAIWGKDMLLNSSPAVFQRLTYRQFGSEEFIKLVGVKITFISSFIINFGKFKSIKNEINRELTHGNDFGQLTFYIPLLLTNDYLFAVDAPVISATGNSNFQYSHIKAFSIDLPLVCKSLLYEKPLLLKMLIRNLIIAYLPSIIYSAKYKKVNSNDEVIPWDEIFVSLRGYYCFWIFVWPIRYLPKYLCLPLVAIGRIFR